MNAAVLPSWIISSEENWMQIPHSYRNFTFSTHFLILHTRHTHTHMHNSWKPFIAKREQQTSPWFILAKWIGSVLFLKNEWIILNNLVFQPSAGSLLPAPCLLALLCHSRYILQAPATDFWTWMVSVATPWPHPSIKALLEHFLLW